MTERELTALVTAITTSVKAELAKDLAQLTPRDGVDGRDGTDGTNGRDGSDGKDGTNGRDGVDGRDGKDGTNGKDVDPTHLLTLEAKLDTLQTVMTAFTPRDGRDGKDGAPGAAGMPGPAGPSGAPGRDAVLKGAMVLKQVDVRRFQFCWDDGTPMTVLDTAGTVVLDSIVRFPVPVHKGVWSDAEPYEDCDVVHVDGSLWIAKRATTTRPGHGASDWQLIVKRGADGPKGKPGDPGPPGRDLTQMDYDGRKW
jgi:Collagen triple helix repeat (20 copies)